MPSISYAWLYWSPRILVAQGSSPKAVGLYETQQAISELPVAS